MKIIDLSQPFTKEMSVYPGTDPPTIEQIATIKNDGYSMIRLDINNHTGTHLDVPGHMIENGKLIQDFSLNDFCGTGIVIDCTNQKEITKDMLKGKIGNHKAVLLHTGWDNLFKKEEYFYNYPVLTKEACEYLIKSKARIVGVDYNSIDPIDSKDFMIHQILLSNELIIYENLCNLKELLTKQFTFYGFPLPIEGDGVQVRAVAILED